MLRELFVMIVLYLLISGVYLYVRAVQDGRVGRVPRAAPVESVVPVRTHEQVLQDAWNRVKS